MPPVNSWETVMVIDFNSGLNSNSTQSRSKANSASAANVSDDSKQTSTAAPAAGDNVSLSAAGKEMSRLANAENGNSQVDSDRVAALRQAISEGSYQIDADAIADKLLQQDQLLP